MEYGIEFDEFITWTSDSGTNPPIIDGLGIAHYPNGTLRDEIKDSVSQSTVDQLQAILDYQESDEAEAISVTKQWGSNLLQDYIANWKNYNYQVWTEKEKELEAIRSVLIQVGVVDNEVKELTGFHADLIANGVSK